MILYGIYSDSRPMSSYHDQVKVLEEFKYEEREKCFSTAYI